jgi:hypothetical protein
VTAPQDDHDFPGDPAAAAHLRAVREAEQDLRAEQEAEPPPPTPLAGVDLEQLDRPLGPRKWLIEGRMTEESFTVLGARPGVGKSWIGEDLALALTLGRPWLGQPVPTPRRVLYLDAENGQDLALRRLRQLGGRSTDLQGRLRYSVEPLVLSRHYDLRRLRLTLDEHQPALLIVDTLASHAPAAETDTEHMADFLADVWSMARVRSCSLLLMHHLRKSLQGGGKDDSLDAFRGAGHLGGAADRAWLLDPLAPGLPKFILRDVKPRGFPCVAPTRISVVDDPDSPADDPATRVEVDGVEAFVEHGYDAFIDACLTFIDAHNGQPVRTADLLHIGSAQPGEPSKRSLDDYLARALRIGVLHKPKRGLWVRAQPTLDDQPTDPEED